MKGKRILGAVAISMAVMMVFAMTPLMPVTGSTSQITTPVYAAESEPAAMALGSESVLKATANTADAQTIWYGQNNGIAAWNVIA